MRNRFEDKIVVITGAASGLGKAACHRFAQEGAKVACLDISGEGAESTAREIGPESAIAAAVDVADEASVKAAIARVGEWHGRIDVLVNCAGIGLPASSLSVSLEEWSRTVGVNLTGPFLMTRTAMPHLIQSKGNVVNIGSTAGLRGAPFQAAYNASKGGVVMLTRSMALEFAAQDVRINAVCPGGIKTPFSDGYINRLNSGEIDAETFAKRSWSPLGRQLAEPDEIVNVIMFLASSEASFVTGSFMAVDGGNTA